VIKTAAIQLPIITIVAAKQRYRSHRRDVEKLERDRTGHWKRIFSRGNMADDDENNKKAENGPPLKQASFEINDADSDVAHNAVRDAVKDLNGGREVNFVGGGVIVTFNPIGITKEEICTGIRRSGYRAAESTSSPGNVQGSENRG
jgi:hypothetical protein